MSFKAPSLDLLYLCYYPVCYDHAGPVPFCYYRFFFWADTWRECDLQNLQDVGRSLVPFDIYFSQAHFRNTAQ